MIYDIIVATICCLGIVFWLYILGADEQYKKLEVIYYFKMAYGLLSFPFTLFLIPGLNFLLVKSRETGYDKQFSLFVY
jgi:hypothetical protein